MEQDNDQVENAFIYIYGQDAILTSPDIYVVDIRTVDSRDHVIEDNSLTRTGLEHKLFVEFQAPTGNNVKARIHVQMLCGHSFLTFLTTQQVLDRQPRTGSYRCDRNMFPQEALRVQWHEGVYHVEIQLPFHNSLTTGLDEIIHRLGTMNDNLETVFEGLETKIDTRAANLDGKLDRISSSVSKTLDWRPHALRAVLFLEIVVITAIMFRLLF